MCPDMGGQPEAERLVVENGIRAVVDLLPRQSRIQMADLYRRSRVVVSPSSHDGTPNTLLEAMASGCFPVAGDLDSIREWITPGVNGLLCDPSNPQAIADSICEGLSNQALRVRSKKINYALVKNRAEYHRVMRTALNFYEKLINQNRGSPSA
jgi:glycosyltransferase involved in cell wall biosynthesis